MPAREELDQFRSEVVKFVESELPEELRNVATIRSAFEENPGASDHAEPSLQKAKEK